MRQGPVDQVGEDLLDHCARPVGQIRLHGREGGVGDKGVVAAAREQLTLAGVDLGVELADPADHQPGAELVAGAGEGGVGGLGDLRVGDPAAVVFVPRCLRVADRGVLQGQMYGRASLTCDDASPVFPATRHFSSI
jgi:hypothetical protein